MTTPDASGTATSGAGKKTALTVVAFVAVAALAATSGALIANSIGGDASSAPATPSEGTVAEVSYTGGLAAGENRGLDDVHQGGRDNALVTADWLAEKIDEGLEENGIVLIDVSEELAASTLTRYPDGHIPGASYVNWSTDFFQANTREFIDQAGFTELAQGLGISDDTIVVLYGDNNNWFATYAAWVFKLYGVPDVRILDGGLFKWESFDQRELVQEVPAPTPGTFEAKPQNFDIRAFQPEVLDIAYEFYGEEITPENNGNLIDIRFLEEFEGQEGALNTEIFAKEATTILGHIPGAVNVPWGRIVNTPADGGDGTFKSNDEIREIYEEAGIDFSQPIIAYCRIGERASHTWYALSQLLEADVKVYDGSWTEWGNSVSVPVHNTSGERGGVWS